MSYKAEFSKIEKLIDDFSSEEFDNVLLECGIESIKPSIESDYVRCLRRRLTEREYCKEIQKYNVKQEYFSVEIFGQEVA